jgi:hypothetical protein
MMMPEDKPARVKDQGLEQPACLLTSLLSLSVNY